MAETHDIAEVLVDIFPEHADLIRDLIGRDPEFVRMIQLYELLNQTLERMKSGREPAAIETIQAGRNWRALVLDEIAERLNLASHGQRPLP